MARPTSTEQKRLNRHINRICSQVDLGTMTKYLDKSTGVYHGPLDSAGIAVVGGSGGIAAGNFVYIDSYSSGVPVVKKAQANSAATSNDVYFAPSAIAAGESGYIFTTATWQTDTSGASAADAPVYLSDSVAGGWTTTKPTLTDIVKILGSVIVKSATVGYINVNTSDESIIAHTHADAANGGKLPLTDTYLYVGDGSNEATGVAMSGDATLANDGTLTLASTESWSMAVPGVSGVATDAGTGCIAGCDQALDLTQTEAAAAYAKVYNHDDTSFANLSASSGNGAFTADYQLFPDAEAENDAAYFGADVAFGQMYLDVDTVATYNGAAASQIWEYSQGSDSWATLTISADSTDVGGAALGQQPFGSDGAITFVPPADWASDTVDSQAAYWIRCRCTAATDITQTPTLNSVEHKIDSPTDGFKAPHDGNISALRIIDANATAHTAADIKFYLMNFTKGTYSLELTFAQDKRQEIFTGTDLKAASAGVDVDAGDVLGLIVTQEDGTNELTNATVELTATLS
jgi:hypothetical protein